MPLKRGRPRESGAGKCHGTPKKFFPNIYSIHSIASENTYKQTAEKCECSESTVKRAMKKCHNYEEAI